MADTTIGVDQRKTGRRAWLDDPCVSCLVGRLFAVAAVRLLGHLLGVRHQATDRGRGALETKAEGEGVLLAREVRVDVRLDDADGGADGISQRAQPAGTSRISLPVGLFQRRS